MPKERIVSQRVVSEKVIGRSNPLARGLSKIKSSITGVCIGPVLIVLALGVLFFSERQKKSSLVVQQLSMQEASEVEGSSGLHKFKGDVKITSPIAAPELDQQVIYYDYVRERYEEVEKTEMETQTVYKDGEQVEQQVETTKIVEEWVTQETKSGWSKFEVGNIEVDPNDADMEVTYKEAEYWKDIFGFKPLDEGTSRVPKIGDEREVIKYIDPETELLIVGDVNNDKVTSGGEVFIISDMSDSQLIEKLKREETSIYWMMKIGTWILLTAGFMMLLSPILTLLDFIPIAGKAASCLATVIAAILAAIIVAVGTLVIKFWWLCLGSVCVGVVVLVGGLVVLIGMKDDNKEKKKIDEPKKEDKKKK